VWEFASLLTRTGVALRRMTAAAEKEFEPVGALYGMWTGAYRAVFDTAGQWQYEFTAQLEGETLSATGITKTDAADSNSNLSQSEEEAVPITFHPVYSGGEVSPLTPFSYDLDGNGAEEEYYLGFLRGDLPGKEYQNRIVVKQLQQGKTVAVRVAPVVWKRDVDGTLTVERMLIFATVGVALTLPFSLSFGLVGFLIIMLLSFFFRFIVDSAIPTALVKIIPESQIGAYSSIRMLIFTASQALAAILVIPLAGVVGYNGLLILAVIMQLICGIGHYLVAKKHKIM